MLRSGIFGVVVSVAMIAGSAVLAQSLNNNRGPAELPPASFTGNQYVDSRGCVFIRAGIGGNVRWVPRVSRDRKVICNQRPSRVAAAPRATAPAPQATQPVRTVSVPRTTPRVVRAAPVTAPARVVAQPTRRVVQYAPAPVAVTRSANTFNSGNCRNRSASAQAFTNNNSDVRCGSQAWHPSQSTRVIQSAPHQQVYGQAPTRHGYQQVAPQRTYQQPVTRRTVAPRALSPRNTYPGTPAWLGGTVDDGLPYVLSQPAPGYRPTWDDGRINHLRGLRYGAVAHSGAPAWVPPRPSNYNSYSSPTYSTRTVVPVPSQPTPRVSGGHRYVQVGTFSVSSNAQRTANRLGGMGYPTRITSSRGYNVVLIGPYSDRGSLGQALSAARRAGFSDAFTRR